MVGSITLKTKGKAKERPKDTQPARTKEGRELIHVVEGSYLTHSPSNVTSMEKAHSSCGRKLSHPRPL